MRDPNSPIVGGPDLRSQTVIDGDRVSRVVVSTIETRGNRLRCTKCDGWGKRSQRKGHRPDCGCIACLPCLRCNGSGEEPA